MRRLIELARTGGFVKNLFPIDPYAVRIVDALRVHDGLEMGAPQLEIAHVLFGSDLVGREWSGSSDYLKSRIRRLMRLARDMAAGKWRRFLR